MESGNLVLCAANAYEQKYYFNEQFSGIPESIQEELRILCVLFTQEVGGVFAIAFEEDGKVSSGLLVGEMRRRRQELFESLQLYYRVFILKEDVSGYLS